MLKFKKPLMIGFAFVTAFLASHLSLTSQASAASINNNGDILQVELGNNDHFISASQGYLIKSWGPYADQYWRDEKKFHHHVSFLYDREYRYQLFCVEWSKKPPSYDHVVQKYQASGPIQWLVNDWEGDRSYSLNIDDPATPNYDTGIADYWLYQTAIHAIANPNDVGDDGTPLQHIDDFNPQVRTKLLQLIAEANKHTNLADSEQILNQWSMGFNTQTLTLNKDNLSNGYYTGKFTFNKNDNTGRARVSLTNAPSGVVLQGNDGAGVDFNDVWNGTGLEVKIPYRINNTKDSWSFTVDAQADWYKRAKIAYIYGNGNPNDQTLALGTVKAISIPIQVNAQMNVIVNPAKGTLSFTKLGSANNNSQVLAGTQFRLSANGVYDQTATANEQGIVSFGNIPLGVDYQLSEVKQPNKYYDGDLSIYNRTITNFNGDNPKLSATVNSNGLAGTVLNRPNYRNIFVQKNNVDKQALRGAGFVLIQVKQNEPLNITSVAQAKQLAMYQDEQGHIVSGDNQGKPYIAKIGMNDSDKKVAEFLMVKSNPDLYDYYVVEVEAPNGYSISVEPIKVDFNDKSPIDLSTTMTDDFKPAIPTTGSDKLLFVGIIGVLFVSGFGALIYYKKHQLG